MGEHRANFWPERESVDPAKSKMVEAVEGQDQRKFVDFGLTQTELKARFRVGATLPFSGEAQGEVVIEAIESEGGRVSVEDRVYRFVGTTKVGHKVKVHIWFSGSENEIASKRTCLFITPNITAAAEAPAPTAYVQFVDGWEKVRDNPANFLPGNILNLSILSPSGVWVPKEVRILKRQENPTNGTIILKVAGEKNEATVVLDTRDPVKSKIIFEKT